MPAETNAIGITGNGLSYVESHEQTKSLNGHDELINSDGTFAEDSDIDPMSKFSVKGKGDLPAGIVADEIASDGSVLANAVAGKTVVPSLEVTAENEKYNSWGFEAENWPSA